MGCSELWSGIPCVHSRHQSKDIDVGDDMSKEASRVYSLMRFVAAFVHALQLVLCTCLSYVCPTGKPFLQDRVADTLNP